MVTLAGANPVGGGGGCQDPTFGGLSNFKTK